MFVKCNNLNIEKNFKCLIVIFKYISFIIFKSMCNLSDSEIAYTFKNIYLLSCKMKQK